MRKLIFVGLLFLIISNACETKQVAEKPTTGQFSSKRKVIEAGTFDIETYQTQNGWAYQILQRGKVLIDQTTIPGRPGMQGFETENAARNVADLVCNKLKAKIFPPTVSEDDLKNLNIH